MRGNKRNSSVPDVIAKSFTGLSGVSLVEVCNNRRILIENHQGVLAYQNNEISVGVRNGNIRVCGERLKLIRMNREQLVITGVISTLHFGEKSK